MCRLYAPKPSPTAYQNSCVISLVVLPNGVVLSHQTLGWPLVKDKMYFALVCVSRNIVMLKIPKVLFDKLSLSSSIHRLNARHAVDGYFSVPTCKSKAGQKKLLLFRE